MNGPLAWIVGAGLLLCGWAAMWPKRKVAITDPRHLPAVIIAQAVSVTLIILGALCWRAA